MNQGSKTVGAVWIHVSKVYKRSKFQPKTMLYEGDMIFQR